MNRNYGEAAAHTEKINREIKELHGLLALAEEVVSEKPDYVFISDTHITAEAQNIAANLLGEIKKHSSGEQISIGFYVEALYSASRPGKGDMRGGVLNWDTRGNTNYRGVVEKALNLQIPVHGIDLVELRFGSEADKDNYRMEHWQQELESGTEQVKIVLVGSGHLWNMEKKPADIMHRLKGDQWLLLNEKAWEAPGSIGRVNVDMDDAQLTQKKYQLLKYKSKS